jgi:hypothetical protein
MPDKGYPIDGWRSTGDIRLRPTLLGLAVIEELVEYEDGQVRWVRRSRWMKPVAIKREESP